MLEKNPNYFKDRNMSEDSEARVIGILTHTQDKLKSPLHSPNGYSQSLNGDEEDPV